MTKEASGLKDTSADTLADTSFSRGGAGGPPPMDLKKIIRVKEGSSINLSLIKIKLENTNRY